MENLVINVVDIRDRIFHNVSDLQCTAVILAEDSGVLSGVSLLRQSAKDIGIRILHVMDEGAEITSGTELARFICSPKELAEAEDSFIGTLAKASGIATAARSFSRCAGNVRIVSGAWKKQPPEIKDLVRRSVVTGGAHFRVTDDPMIYLDKNYTAVLGGIGSALQAVSDLPGKKVIQIKGRWCNHNIVQEALEAMDNGADIIYVDTGRLDDLSSVSSVLREKGFSGSIVFGGGVTYEAIPEIIRLGADIIGVGRKIIDAPLLDMKLEVIGTACKV